MDAWATVDDAGVRAALTHLLAFGRNQSEAMHDIADLGESTTRMRFRDEVAPDGTRWKQSLRAQISGGRTLTKDGHLSGSISSGYGNDYAEWGVNRVYAQIHQEGGEIRPRHAASLRFRLANGAFATVKKVTMPARPFLGVNDDDAADILDILSARIDAATAAADARFGRQP